MRIAVIGGGAIGLLMSSYLAEHAHVTLYTRRKEQRNQLRTNGVTLKHKATEKNVKVDARILTSNENFEQYELVIIAVKQYGIKEVIPYLMKASKHTSLLFVQNGMSHLGLAQNLPQHNVYLGVVEHGAMKEADDVVIHSGVGITRVALFRGDHLIPFQQFHSTEFGFVWENDWYEMLIQKLIVNAVINPLTALYRVKNGEITANPFFYKTAKAVFNELHAVLRLKEPTAYWNRVVDVCEKTAQNHSSMRKDLQQQRKTEVESILGYILEEAAQRQVNTPIIQFVYNGILGLEDSEGR
ncbi:2-dehydropantoate 2-reductase [Priestia aryabhattai]|uniref:2-dehydropantoate 2-reductase n=1 Tax=Bacillaceae TaxID=186817 RepID=UPI000BA0E29E|nr:2-dehydropantoate 2-reductase [Bacillus sp. CBEL-1]OZT13267.1 2-dehydropantoate 2-reductase [Priestia aryabhattai]TDB50571.1 2-dehydropantoate 2-reductase [Bacillus sp. CBEL-1]